MTLPRNVRRRLTRQKHKTTEILMGSIDPNQLYKGDMVLGMLAEQAQNHRDLVGVVMQQRDAATNNLADEKVLNHRLERQLQATLNELGSLRKTLEEVVASRDALLAEKRGTGEEPAAAPTTPPAPPVH